MAEAVQADTAEFTLAEPGAQGRFVQCVEPVGAGRVEEPAPGRPDLAPFWAADDERGEAFEVGPPNCSPTPSGSQPPAPTSTGPPSSCGPCR